MSQSHTIDFAALNLQDALDLGILIEEDARERYSEFVDQLKVHHTPQAAAFFAAMVRNETKHRDWLTQRRRSLFKDADVFMTRRQALDVAMKAEVRAFEFFAAALVHVRDAEVRALFEELRDEEAEHQQMVQREMDKLPPGNGPDLAGLADEPVAQ